MMIVVGMMMTILMMKRCREKFVHDPDEWRNEKIYMAKLDDDGDCYNNDLLILFF